MSRAKKRRIDQSLVVSYVPPASLKPDPSNPRRMSAGARAKLRRGMQWAEGLGVKAGLLQPIIARREDGLVVGGHQRLLQAEELRLPEVPVVYVEGLSDQEARALNVLLNNPEAQGEFDPDQLATLLRQVQGAGIDPTLTGFDPNQVLELVGAAAGKASRTEDGDVTPPVRPKSKAGQLYELGEHLVLCGDARDQKAIGSLLKGRTIDCIYTDPPYGVDYRAEGYRPIRGDQAALDALVALLVAAFRPAKKAARPDCPWYIWHASATRKEFTAAMDAIGITERQYLTWVKPAITLGWAHYQWATEPCFYASDPAYEPRWFGGRDQSTVWRITAQAGSQAIVTTLGTGLLVTDGRGTSLYLAPQPPKAKKLRHIRLAEAHSLTLSSEGENTDAWEVARDHQPDHPTQKPVALALRALRNSCQPGETVYDAFAGAGATLLAAEVHGCRAILVERDPGYVDVIRRRYAEATGQPDLLP